MLSQSQRGYDNFSSQSLFLIRYKNCPYRKGLAKEESNSRKFKRPKDLVMISKLSSTHQKPKTKNYNKYYEYESIFVSLLPRYYN